MGGVDAVVLCKREQLKGRRHSGIEPFVIRSWIVGDNALVLLLPVIITRVPSDPERSCYHFVRMTRGGLLVYSNS